MSTESKQQPVAFRPVADRSRDGACPGEAGTDNLLINRFLRGDEAAFDDLLLRHQQRAFSIAYGLLGNHEDAAEVTQDAFVKVYRVLQTFRQESSFTTWLYRIVTNLAHNKHRYGVGRGKGRTVSLDDEEAPVAPLEDGGPTAREQVMTRESHETFLAALDRLRPEHREVIVMYSIQDLSYDEMAATLQLSLGTVKSRLFRAREDLARHMKGEE